MISVQGFGRFRKKRSFVALLDSSPTLESDDKLFDELAGPVKASLLIIVVLATTPFVPKYTIEDL